MRDEQIGRRRMLLDEVEHIRLHQLHADIALCTENMQFVFADFFCIEPVFPGPLWQPRARKFNIFDHLVN